MTSKSYPQTETLLVPCGLSNALGEFAFLSDGTSSKIQAADANTSVCRVVAFDEMFSNVDIDYVKMDIEGAELSALEGMADMLARCRPVVALSAYHKWDDIPVLMSFLIKNIPNGRFFLRQHA